MSDGRQVGNNSNQSIDEKFGISTTSRDNTSTPSVDPTLREQPVAVENNFLRFGRILDNALKGSTPFKPSRNSILSIPGLDGYTKDGRGNGNQANPTTGSVKRFDYGKIFKFSGIIDNISKDLYEPINSMQEINNPKDGVNEIEPIYQGTEYDIAKDSVRPIGPGHEQGNETYYPGDTMTKTIITKSPSDNQYYYQDIPCLTKR